MLSRNQRISLSMAWLILIAFPIAAEDFRSVRLSSRIKHVQPMTGIALWSDNAATKVAPIQLEFAYLNYGQVVTEKGKYRWDVVDKLLESIASRGHQAILRWNDTYVGSKTGVPRFLQNLPDYETTRGMSEGKATEFPDWSHPELGRFTLEFMSRFAERYDRDARLAFVQVGFGLWSEYHIYDGPMISGKTFPSHEFQAEFARHLANTFRDTPWMISIDAAGDWAPFATTPPLLDLRFGVFDDSFNHKRHREENEPNWNVFGRDRWKVAPAGGEFSFFESRDQKRALDPRGPHGISFETQAARFHVSFIIGDDQPQFQNAQRIREAGQACGYRFRVTRLEVSRTSSRVEIANEGIAPIYYDAFPAVNGVRSQRSLKGLLPGNRTLFAIDAGGASPTLTIECDRLVKGQQIEFEAEIE